jgi:hypothetical protein
MILRIKNSSVENVDITNRLKKWQRNVMAAVAPLEFELGLIQVVVRSAIKAG